MLALLHHAAMAALPVAQIRGANLGSTFVPENWMVPSFYADTGTSTLCAFVRKDPKEAAERMHQHLEHFLTEDDFMWLSKQGFNAVRIPLGYWNALGSAVGGVPYVPTSADESLAFLDRWFEWSRAHGLAVLLDLHGGAGSQNGADHSGCDDGIGFGEGDTIELSLSAVDALVQRCVSACRASSQPRAARRACLLRALCILPSLLTPRR